MIPPILAAARCRHAVLRRAAAIMVLWLVNAVGAGLSLAEDPPPSSPAAKAAYTAAAALQNRGAWDLAADAWSGLLRDHPRDPLAAKGRYYLGLCRLQEGKWPDAAEAFRGVVESAGKEGGADRDTVALARWELGRGAFADAQTRRTPDAFREAAAALGEFLAIEPAAEAAAEASFLLAEARWQSGDRPAALEDWQRFIREHPRSPRLPAVLYALGVAQAETGQATEAAATLRRLAESFPDDALADEVAIRRADLALAADQPVEAAKLVVEIAQRKDGPQIDAALERLGLALWRQKRHAAAAQAYDILVSREPAIEPRASALLSASAAWSEAGKIDDARERLVTLLAMEGIPAAVATEASERLARIEIAAGHPQAAVAAAESGLARAARRVEDGETGAGDGPLVARLQLVLAEGLADLPERRDDCLAVLRRLLDEHPEETVVGPALAMESAVLLGAGRTDEALAAADRFLALPAERRGDSAVARQTVADVRAIRAEALLARGEARRAADDFRDLVAVSEGDPRVAHTKLRWGAALVASEDWEGAHAVLSPLTTVAGLEDDDGPQCLLLDATALVELSRAKESVALLSRIDAEYPAWPRRPEAMLLAIRARREAGDTAGAVAIAEQLLSTAPPAAIAERAWYRLGHARQESGDEAGAIEAFAEARRLAPQSPRVPAGLLAEGWCHEARGALDRAVERWSEVVERHPDSAACVAALLARGDARQRAAAPAEGLADAERVLAMESAGDARVDAAAAAQARFLAGLCQAAVGRTAEAIDSFTKLLATAPDFPAADRVLLELGLARSATGESAAAEAALNELRRRFPRSSRLADAWLETGEIRFAAADWKGAAEAYANVSSSAPQGSGSAAVREQALHKLAWTHAMRQDQEAAVRAFADQLAEHPDGVCAADGRAMLGDGLVRLGRFDEAKKVLAEALASRSELSSPDLVGLATVRAAECAAKEERFEESLDLVDRWLAADGGTDGRQAREATVTQARFARALARQNLGRLDEALEEYRALADAGLDRGTERGPGELAARARLMEGEILFEQGLHKEAIAAFFKVAYGFGETRAPASFHPWQAQATYEAARCFEVLGKTDQARGLYAELVERYPATPYVPAARKRIDALSAGGKNPP
jgi:TolA-binding protein